MQVATLFGCESGEGAPETSAPPAGSRCAILETGLYGSTQQNRRRRPRKRILRRNPTMRSLEVMFVISLIPLGLLSAAGESPPQNLHTLASKLKPLHKPMGEPKPGDWLSVRTEPGQTFKEYLRARPETITDARNKIYIQPMGQFSGAQERIVALTADFLGRYYGAKTEMRPNIPLSVIPKKARRIHPVLGGEQVLTTYILYEVLKPRLPKDAVAYIALTASDLWPGKGWNFVFGQASITDRVGVWSIHRNGDPEASAEEFRLCLLRTMKTAAHEVGHMLSMYHCTLYDCGMNGSNHREEADRRPVSLCPECIAKLWWATRVDPVARFRKLAEFCKTNDLKLEAEYYDKATKLLKAKEAKSDS